MTTKLYTLTDRAEVTRRDALKLLAGGVGLLAAGCLEAPGQDIVPYVVEPPEAHPSEAVTYATALQLDGEAYGVLATLHEGRPTKLRGNPAHPGTRGGSTPWLEARTLDLYDPQRARHVTNGRASTSWEEIARMLGKLEGPVWLVMPPQSSPSIAALIDRVRERVELHVVYDAPFGRREALHGARLAFGDELEAQHELRRADVIVALDCDVLADPALARAAAERRVPGPAMSRLWVCEPMLTPTGTLADHRLAVPAGDIAALATVVLDRLAREGLGGPNLPGELVTLATKRLGAGCGWAYSLADELVDHGAAACVVVGARQPAVVHALAHWIQALCKSRAVTYTRSPLLRSAETLADLADARPSAVIAVDCNPAYTFPARELFAAPFTMHAGLWTDETARACQVRVPLAHELETWSDPRARDGTRAIAQPVIRPRFTAISPLEVLAALSGIAIDPRAFVRDTAKLDERAWRHALAQGVIDDTAEPAVTAEPRRDHALVAELRRVLTVPEPPLTYEVARAPSHVHDGRFAGNAWLQELPHPITKHTWTNAAMMSPTTAVALGVSDGDVVRIAGLYDLPALVVPEHAERSITIDAGYGHDTPDLPIANRLGVNAFALPARAFVTATGACKTVARTQHEMGRAGRELAPVLALGANYAELGKLRGPQPSLLPAPQYPGLHWAMTIDTSLCTGCSACMVACQAENNIPTVGADDVARGRHMNWLRIDRYVEPQVNQPMMCQHCEQAPCEYVCPVEATVHSYDGLNEMVYNRCVGTRFCSNNCPYKVRRFNWFAYERKDESALQYNPDVTVRSRGVMEKCTYCVQRIRGAEIRARVEHREIGAGEVETACQQACPMGAIRFGALEHDPALRSDPRLYETLHELGTRPRTVYLARVTNPRRNA